MDSLATVAHYSSGGGPYGGCHVGYPPRPDANSRQAGEDNSHECSGQLGSTGYGQDFGALPWRRTPDLDASVWRRDTPHGSGRATRAARPQRGEVDAGSPDSGQRSSAYDEESGRGDDDHRGRSQTESPNGNDDPCHASGHVNTCLHDRIRGGSGRTSAAATTRSVTARRRRARRPRGQRGSASGGDETSGTTGRDPETDPPLQPLPPHDTAISVQQSNPKRAGSKCHRRYEGYKQARTVREFYETGGRAVDLRNDHERGYVACAEMDQTDATVSDDDENRVLY